MLDYKQVSGDKKKRKLPDIIVEIAKLIFASSIVGVVAFFLIYGYTQFSHRFAVLKNVYVNGNSVLSAKYLASVGIGKFYKPLSSYSESRIYANLMSVAWIKKASVAKVYPDSIVINVVEKSPKALVYLNKSIFVVDKNGDIIGRYSSFLKLPGLAKIYINNKTFLDDKKLVKSVIAFYEKLDKIAKINYIEIVSDSYQIAYLVNGLKVGINSFGCPDVALVNFKRKLPYLLSMKKRLESVSICFSNKFVLKWKKGVKK
ncbi:cell division protein FtsQ/DivIB [Hippea alviniae]|uniref:cell division protein FtsQ/DivIB n=1 Tax=Hippea alviniae TaxID=1279027 RepID=UPI0003B35EBB|nr:FtsQ-type POTRA domain-containing protein [Hippea alviniae]